MPLGQPFLFSPGQQWEFVLYFHHVDPGIELRFLGLAASSFTQ